MVLCRVWKVVRAAAGLGLASCALLGAGVLDVGAAEVHGPLAIRNQSPIQVLFFQFVPERAVPLGHKEVLLRVDISETNTLTADTGRDSLSGRLDLEMTYANVQARIGLDKDWEVGVDVPIIAMHGPFMDSFIDWFERLINYERTIRAEEREQGTGNQFTYRVSRNGETILQGVDGRVGVGDMAFQVKWAPPPLRETASSPAVAMRLALKVPTGDADAAFGSGRPDIAVGLALEKTFARWTLHGNLNMTVPIGSRFDGLDIQPIYSGLLGFEYRFVPALAVVGQLSANSAPFLDTGLAFFDDWSDWAALGLSWAPSRAWRVQGGIMENLFTSADAGADFGFFLSASCRFAL